MYEPSVHRVVYTGFYDDQSRPVRGVVPGETAITLYVNGEPLVRLLCTPTDLEELALGFLLNEGLIDGLDDVAVIELCSGGQGVDVWLKHDIESPTLRSVTSGCSGGTTFEAIESVEHPVISDLTVTPAQVTAWVEELSDEATLYRRAGGVHTAALARVDHDGLVCVAEDVGRHNTLDKMAGRCLRSGQPTRDTILLTSGRVSSEMVSKAARMGVPVVVSRTSPTSMSITLAEAWGITVIGYARRRSFRVYTGSKRIVVAS